MMVIPSVLRRYRFVFAEAEVATATTTTAAVATSDNTADHKQCLARGRRHNEVSVDILLAELFGNIQSEGSIVIIDVSLR